MVQYGEDSLLLTLYAILIKILIKIDENDSKFICIFKYMGNEVLVLNENVEEKRNIVREISEMLSQIKNDKFDDKEYIIEKNHEFCQAVQQMSPKMHMYESEDEFERAKKGKYKNRAVRDGVLYWGVNDSYADWLVASLDTIEFRIEEIKKKKENRIYEVPTNFQLQIMGFKTGESDDIKFADESELEQFGIEWYEFLEWHINHQKEAIKKFLRDEITFTQEEFIKSEMKIEIGKLLMKAGERRQAVREQASIINKAQNGTTIN